MTYCRCTLLISKLFTPFVHSLCMVQVYQILKEVDSRPDIFEWRDEHIVAKIVLLN